DRGQGIIEIVGHAARNGADTIHALRTKKLRLNPLLLGDVLNRSDHTDSFAGFISDSFGLFPNDSDIAIGPNNPVLKAEQLTGCKRLANVVLDFLLIGWMNTFQKRLEGGCELSWGKAENGEYLVGPPQFIGGDIPFPVAEPSNTLRFAQTGLAVAEGFL